MVLIVAIHGDYTGMIRAIFQEPVECRFQRGTFAQVDRMLQQLDFGMCGSCIGKIMKVLRLTAIIDQNDVLKTVFQQTFDHNV